MDNKLSENKRKELNSHFAKRDLPECPRCHTKENVIPSVRGKPTTDLILYANEGHVKLSGCCHSYQGWCKKCEQYIQ